MRLCYVVHRYPPYAGGSEYYVQGMAEESLRRSHDVTVYTDEHNGDLNGVKVTSDPNIFDTKFDLVIVHGADVRTQNNVLRNAKKINSTILYMIILPSESAIATQALQDCAIVGCSTAFDWRYVLDKGVAHKSAYIRHSIPSDIKSSYGRITNTNGQTACQYFNIDTKYMFLSCGGYWPNKAMHELVNSFEKCELKDTTLVLTGYANKEQAPKEKENVRVLVLDERQKALDLLASANLYIMNSFNEGFGLVLLEAMLNSTPWAARGVGGAIDLEPYGYVYMNDSALETYMKSFSSIENSLGIKNQIDLGKQHVLDERKISDTVDDIESAYARYITK